MADGKLLIDAKDALDVLCGCCDVEGCCPPGKCAEYQKISKLPTVDAVEFDYRAGYDFVMALQEELAAQHHDAEIGCLDYKVIKALAATYELQDYLANRIAQAVAEGELDPDPEE